MGWPIWPASCSAGCMGDGSCRARTFGAASRPLTVAQADDFLLWITLGIVIGGRLGFVLFYEPSYFWQNPIEIPAVWHGGMSFHGGLLGVALAVYQIGRA